MKCDKRAVCTCCNNHFQARVRINARCWTSLPHLHNQVQREARLRRAAEDAAQQSLAVAQARLATAAAEARTAADREVELRARRDERESVAESAERRLALAVQERTAALARMEAAAAAVETAARDAAAAQAAATACAAAREEATLRAMELENVVLAAQRRLDAATATEEACAEAWATARGRLDTHSAVLMAARAAAADLAERRKAADNARARDAAQRELRQRAAFRAARSAEHRDALDAWMALHDATSIAAAEADGISEPMRVLLAAEACRHGAMRACDAEAFARRVEALGSAATCTPIPELTLAWRAKIFERLDDGSTVRRRGPGSLPSSKSGVVGRVSHADRAASCGWYTALADRAFDEGRHAWDWDIVEFCSDGGGGMLVLGVVWVLDSVKSGARCKDRCYKVSADTAARGGALSAAVSKAKATAEMAASALDLNHFCIGEDSDKISWGVSTDGTVLRGGAAVSFAGRSLAAGDVLTCFLDCGARTIALAVDGRLLGGTLHGAPWNPAIPALSITREAACRVAISNYRRW